MRRTVMLTVSALACSLLTMLAGLVFWSLLPVTFGWHPTVVMSGSMEPRLHVGDVVVSRPVATSALHPGEVVLVHDPDHAGRLRLHRYAKVTNDGEMILRGDANAADDSSPVSPDAVLGVATLRIPDVGRPLVWLSTGDVAPFAGLVAGLVVLALLGSRCHRGSGPGDGVGGRGVRPRRRRRTTSPALTRTVAVATVVVAIVGIGSAAEAATRFSGSVTSGSSFAAATYFSCASAASAGNASLAYSFADNGSKVTDVSGNGRSGTIGGSGTTHAQDGPCGGGVVTFNGNGYVLAPGPMSAPSIYSIETWFRTTTATGVLVGFGNSSLDEWSLSYGRELYLTPNGQLLFGTYSGLLGRYSTITTGRVTDGAWHHVVATQSAAGMRLYLDGALVGSNSASSAQSISGYWHLGSNSTLGWPSAPTNNHYVGSLGFTAIYPTALDAATVADHFQTGQR